MSCMELTDRLLYLEQQCSISSNIELIARCVNLRCGAWMDVCNIITRFCGLCVVCVRLCDVEHEIHPTLLRLWTM